MSTNHYAPLGKGYTCYNPFPSEGSREGCTPTPDAWSLPIEGWLRSIVNSPIPSLTPLVLAGEAPYQTPVLSSSMQRIMAMVDTSALAIDPYPNPSADIGSGNACN